MKKSKFLLFLSIPLLLTSCSDPGTTSTDTSFSNTDTSVTDVTSVDSSDDSTTSVDVSHTLTAALLREKVQTLVSATSLTLGTNSASGYLQTYLNEEYVLNADNTGLIKLPYAGSGIVAEKYLYNFDLVDNNVELKNIATETDYATGQTVGVSSTASYNPFASLSYYFEFDMEFEGVTEQEDGSVTVTDLSLIMALQSVVGLDDDTLWNNIDSLSLKFYLDDTNFLSFAVVGSDGNVFNDMSGYAKDVGTTNVELLDTYIANFALPSEKLSRSAFNDLLDDTFSTVLTLTSYDSAMGNSEEKIYFDKEPTKSYVYSDSALSSISSTIYKTLSNGNVGMPYITYDNKVAEDDLGVPYSYVFPSLSSSLREGSYRKVDDTTYKYWDFVNPLAGLTGVTINVAFEEVTLKLDSEGKLAYIEGTTETVYYTDGSTSYMTFKLEVLDDVAVPELEPYEETANTAKIAEIFDNFKNTTSYQLVNVYGGETMTVTDDVILNVSEDYMGNTNVSGYLEKNGGVIRFTKEGDNFVAAAPFKEGVTLDDYLTFDVSPLIFTLSSDGTTIAANDFVDKLGGHFVGGSYGDLCYLNSLVFEVTDDKITGFNFTANLGFGYGDTGYDVVYGTAEEPVTIPSDVMESLDSMSLEFEIPTDFSDCVGDIWDALVTMYGEETARTIPYLYDEQFHGGWDVETMTSSSDGGITWDYEYLRVFEGQGTFTTDYLERYAQLLLDNGYEEVEPSTYVKGTVSIYIGSSMAEGFTFRVYSAE